MVADVGSCLVLIAVTAWRQVLQLGPYVAIGIVLAALLRQLDADRLLRKLLSQGGPAQVLCSACLGGLSPFSTLSTVPMLAQSLRRGTPPGPALAFVSASSMLNPQLFVLIWGGLGLRMAILQVVCVLVISVLVGLTAGKLAPMHLLQLSTPAPPSPIPGSRWVRLCHDVLGMAEWIGPTFVAGVLLAAAFQVLVPPGWAANLFGQNRWTGGLLASLLSVPMYSCGGSAVPVLSTMSRLGADPAIPLAFLVAGPATRLTALLAMGSLLNRRALGVYVVGVVGGAAVLGSLLA